MPAPPGYVDVADRIQRFYEKHPNGSLQSEWSHWETGDVVFVVCVAWAYRDPEDERPGVGLAWEPFPGPTPFTKDSELQNAQTSAWGRALVAIGFLSKDEAIATAQEVEAREASRQAPPWSLPAEGALLDQAKQAVRDLAGGHASLLAQTIKEANGGVLPVGVAIALVNAAAANIAAGADAQVAPEPNGHEGSD